MIRIDYVVSGELAVNCYFIYDDVSKKAIIIDPGQDDKTVINKIENLKLKPELLINTHGHFDHILCDDIIRQKYNIPLAIHSMDTDMLSDPSKNASVMIGVPTTIKHADIIFDKEEDAIQTSFCKYSVFHTPGHTKGSISILIDDFLFSGDTLFAGSIGRTDLPSGNYNDMLMSLKKLSELNKNIDIYPGHGGFTSLKEELLNNPYLR